MIFLKPAAFILMSLVATSLALATGNSSSGGGSEIAAEFSRYANSAILRMDAISPIYAKSSYDVDTGKLQEIYKLTKVFAVDHALYLKGHSVMAINNPKELTITFNALEWKKLDTNAKTRLVIHELLGLTFSADISDANYSYSEDLAKQISHVRDAINLNCDLFGHLASRPGDDMNLLIPKLIDTYVPNGGYPMTTDDLHKTIPFNLAAQLKGHTMTLQLIQDDVIVVATNYSVENSADYKLALRMNFDFQGSHYSALWLKCEDLSQKL